MNDQQADEFMKDHDWSKWSDCRDMVQEAYAKGRREAGRASALPQGWVAVRRTDLEYAFDVMRGAIRFVRESGDPVERRIDAALAALSA